MIKLSTSGSFSKTEKFLKSMLNKDHLSALQQYGEMGVKALASATPVESGHTANSWVYSVEQKGGRYTITWSNTHVEDGVNIAIILSYGHGTGTGGWVAGKNYINPAIQPIMDKIADDVWEKVRHA